MGFKVTNIAEVTTMFKMMDRDVPRAARDALRVGAQKITKTAIAFAPVDKHNLEKAIKMVGDGNQFYTRYIIHVGGTVGGRNVDAYATIVHEYPWNKRGPKTRAKSPRAGPRYLGRAVEEHKRELIQNIGQAMGAAMKRSVAKSGVNKRRRTRR